MAKFKLKHINTKVLQSTPTILVNIRSPKNVSVKNSSLSYLCREEKFYKDDTFRVCTIKYFTAVITSVSKWARMFATVNHFYPSMPFPSKDTSGASYGAPILGLAALSANIKPGESERQ